MAKVRNNLVVRGLSGMLGKQLVVRHRKDGGFVVAAAPHRNSDAEPTAAQKLQQDRFRQASLYAKGAVNRKEYQDAAKARGLSPRNVAMADFFHPPVIEAIDLSAYHGAVGQTIGITATDDVKVDTVDVLITSDEGMVVEKGAAVLSADGTRWTYTATAAAPNGTVKVTVDVADLVSHVTERVELVNTTHQ